MRLWNLGLVATTLVVACADANPAFDPNTGTGSAGTISTGGAASGDDRSADATTEPAPGDSGGRTDGSLDGSMSMDDPDDDVDDDAADEQGDSSETAGEECLLGDPCLPFVELCAASDEHCIPEEIDGPSAFASFHCAVLVDGPHNVGETCERFCATDSCEEGSFCLTNEDSEEGVCVALCDAGHEKPCKPLEDCQPYEGIASVCALPSCDPLLQNCTVGSCHPSSQNIFPFGCAPFGEGVFGDPCSSNEECGEGLLCFDACGIDPCCTYFCSGDGECPSNLCEPYFEEGDVPVGYDGVGVCIE